MLEGGGFSFCAEMRWTSRIELAITDNETVVISSGKAKKKQWGGGREQEVPAGAREIEGPRVNRGINLTTLAEV